MTAEICETCGHPEASHEPERCLWCEADKECQPDIEVCDGFKPDMFDMWEDDEEDISPT